MAVKELKFAIWQDVVQLTQSLHSKMTEANSEYTSMQQKLKDALDENLRLQESINVLKKKPCAKCAKLIECTEMLKKKLKEKDDTISVIGKLFLNHNPESYALASQMVNDVITSSTADITVYEKSTALVNSDLPEESNAAALTTPEKKDNASSVKKESPIYAKKIRNNKRKFLSISSMKKSKLSNGDVVSNCVGQDDESESEKKLFNVDDEKAVKMDEECDKLTDYNSQLNSVASPEILSSTFQTGSSISKNDDTTNMTPANNFRKSRRSLEMKFTNSDEKKPISPEVEKIFDPNQKWAEAKKCEPMDFELAEAVQPLPEPLTESCKDAEKQPHKTVWNLKKSRELTIKRLKQTVLSTAVFEKKVDISTSSQYKGGSIPLIRPKPDANGCKFSCKENVDDTFFEPAVTSTHNDYEIGAQPCQSKVAALAESTNKPRTPVKIEDSFDCLPSTSPKYKYKRDAVRKKSERLKLPGQECAKCLDFYSSKKLEFTNSQVKKLMNKCSRHRDKFPIQVYTPPGLWNPVFDDTDEEVDNK